MTIAFEDEEISLREEIEALDKITIQMLNLDAAARKRVVLYITDRFYPKVAAREELEK